MDPYAWQKPRRFDITGRLRDGRNHLVARVRALGGLTGMYDGVVIRERRRNLLDGGCFARDMPAWTYTVTPISNVVGDTSADPITGVTAANLSGRLIWADGEYAEERALLVQVSPDRRIRMERIESTRLTPGTYRLQVRHAQIPTHGRPSGNPMTIRLATQEPGVTKAKGDLVTLRMPSYAVPDWSTTSATFKVTDETARQSVVVTVEFHEPGHYQLSEIHLSEITD